MANEVVPVQGNGTGVVQYQSLSGIDVVLTPEIVKKSLVRGRGDVTDQEVAMFLRTCQAKKLDPLENGEVYLIKYDSTNPAQMVVGYHAYARRADRFPDYRGLKAGITVLRKLNGKEEVVQREGQCVYKALGETLIGGWCTVYRERRTGYVEESFVEVALDEYSSNKGNWTSKPATMIRKVAISQALRQAFPNEYEGLYTIDEMDASGAFNNHYVDPETGEVVKANPIPAEKTVVADDNPTITDEERRMLFAKITELFGKERTNDMLKSILSQNGYPDKTTELKKSQMAEIIALAEDIAANEAKEDKEEASGDDTPF